MFRLELMPGQIKVKTVPFRPAFAQDRIISSEIQHCPSARSAERVIPKEPNGRVGR
jgi:hypothetical protein